ncbi:MAG TPA: ABC transporter permease [Acidimicrobiales bacterium]|nr:ABC transporter permease [Acidimicrobiales bacterium]
MRRSFTIFKNELRILRRDPEWLILVFLIPLILVGLMRGGVRFILILTGHPGASGADFSVPAQAVTFVFYLPGLIGFSFLREHGWATWVRLRASGTPQAQLLLGKILPILVLGLLQMLVVFGVGTMAFGLQTKGSAMGVALVASAVVVTAVAMGLAITAIVRTVQQLNAVGNILPVALGALGGALMPLATLPAWVHHVAPATPQYWAMRGFNGLILDGQGLTSVILPMLMLISFTVAFATVAIVGFRAAENRLSFG